MSPRAYWDASIRRGHGRGTLWSVKTIRWWRRRRRWWCNVTVSSTRKINNSDDASALNYMHFVTEWTGTFIWQYCLRDCRRTSVTQTMECDQTAAMWHCGVMITLIARMRMGTLTRYSVSLA